MNQFCPLAALAVTSLFDPPGPDADEQAQREDFEHDITKYARDVHAMVRRPGEGLGTFTMRVKAREWLRGVN